MLDLDDGTTAIFSDIGKDREQHEHDHHLEDHIHETLSFAWPFAL